MPLRTSQNTANERGSIYAKKGDQIEKIKHRLADPGYIRWVKHILTPLLDDLYKLTKGHSNLSASERETLVKLVKLDITRNGTYEAFYAVRQEPSFKLDEESTKIIDDYLKRLQGVDAALQEIERSLGYTASAEIPRRSLRL